MSQVHEPVDSRNSVGPPIHHRPADIGMVVARQSSTGRAMWLIGGRRKGKGERGRSGSVEGALNGDEKEARWQRDDSEHGDNIELDGSDARHAQSRG
jgi:hypothetical protein